MEKLLLIDMRDEGKRKRGTQINIYGETLEILKDLNVRTEQSLSMLANRLIKFAYSHVEIDSEEEEKQ